MSSSSPIALQVQFIATLQQSYCIESTVIPSLQQGIKHMNTAFEVAELGSNPGSRVPGHQILCFYSFTCYLPLTKLKTWGGHRFAYFTSYSLWLTRHLTWKRWSTIICLINCKEFAYNQSEETVGIGEKALGRNWGQCPSAWNVRLTTLNFILLDAVS